MYEGLKAAYQMVYGRNNLFEVEVFFVLKKLVDFLYL